MKSHICGAALSSADRRAAFANGFSHQLTEKPCLLIGFLISRSKTCICEWVCFSADLKAASVKVFSSAGRAAIFAIRFSRQVTESFDCSSVVSPADRQAICVKRFDDQLTGKLYLLMGFRIC